MNKKNVILITVDECKYSAMSTYGNPYVNTYGAEYAKNNGAMFEHSYVVHAKCVPSRCALLSGRYVHTNGHRTLPGFELTTEENNLASILKNRGYKTAMFGKNHTFEGKDVDKYFDEYTTSYKSKRNEMLRNDEVDLNDPMWKAFYRGNWYDKYNGETDDFYFVEDGLNFIEKNKDDNFFLLLNLIFPHPVYFDMDPYIEEIKKRNIKLPPVEDLEAANNTLKMYRQIYDLEDLTEDERIQIAASYLSMVEYVDNEVLKIYKKIEDENLKDDTIIIYTSDHGDFAGEHNAYEKYDTMFYDCLVRTPLFIQYPPIIKSKKYNELVENIDILPTILDILEIEKDADIHGESLLSYIIGDKDTHKSIVFCEGGVESAALELAPHYDSDEYKKVVSAYYLKQKVLVDFTVSMQRSKMARTKDWKFIYRCNGERELYNMREDIHELNNVANEHEDICCKFIEELLKWEIKTEPDYPKIKRLFA